MFSSEYDTFAWFYNRFWGDYSLLLFRSLEEVLAARLPPSSRLLDLCCGSGQVAGALAARGYQVTGLDSSNAMLRFARVNAPGVPLLRGDARSFAFKPVFAAVISTFDSLNHLLCRRDLVRVFENVFRVLQPGGLFLFDLNMERGFTERWAEHFSVVDEESACILRGSYEPAQRMGRFDITLFRKVRDCWQRSDCCLLQRCHPREEVLEAAQTTGFWGIEVLRFDADLGLEEQTGRELFLLRKPE